MVPRKIGNQYQITYRCHGYSKVINEYFPTEEEANLRIAEINVQRMRGTLQPPAHLIDPDRDLALYREKVTVRLLMDEYIKSYGLTHWSISTLSYNRHRIEDYIIPYIGDVRLKDLTTHRLEKFYQDLQNHPAVKTKGHEDEEKNISPDVIEKVHAIIRNALNQAIRWDYLRGSNPAYAVELPKHKKKKLVTWTNQEVFYALEVCEDSILKLCMLLAIGCSMRIGEILGLTWDCVHITPDLIESGNAWLRIDKELLRCDKSCIEDLHKQGRDNILLTFPSLKKSSSTSLVLKVPKTESSIRSNYIPATVANALLEMKHSQEAIRSEIGSEFQDFNLVIAQSNGRPYERRLINDKLKALIHKHNLPEVPFHSLRHSSTTIKLHLSGGDIKSVQGDNGHSVADMVTNVYSEIQDEDRKQLSHRMESDFFSPHTSSPSMAPAHPSESESDPLTKLLQMAEDSPEKLDKLMQIAELL